MVRHYTRWWWTMSALALIGAGAGTFVPPARAVGLPPVSNAGLLGKLNPSQQAALARNGFVVTAPARVRDTRNIEGRDKWYNADPHHEMYWQFFDLYDDNFKNGIPNFVTSDAVLHTFHIIYDQTLVALERTSFIEKLTRMNSGLMDSATYQYGAATDPAVKAAARLNLGYVAVARRLLDPSSPVPALVAPQVAQELSLIAAHRGFASSPLFGYAVDYSKFVPRGHYTATPELRHYFQAMTWYGLLTFHLNGPDGALRTRQALLLVRSLTLIPQLGKLWSAVFDPITAWVGRSDDLTVRDYAALMTRVYPANAPVTMLADAARLARFIALANQLPGPQINGDLAASSKNMNTTEKGMRLFGQRFVPDASIMQSLVWDKVGTAQQKRLWSSGLDVAAALGSARATALQQGETRFAHYTQQLAVAQRTYGSLPAGAWSQNLYWSWLDTLRAVWRSIPAAAPAFMHSGAWTDKSLNTGLGSWAELRHDTLLYAKQPGGFGGGGLPTPIPATVAYVEPVPAVYARLRALTAQMQSTLQAEGFLDTLPTPNAFSASTLGDRFQALVPRGEHGYRAALDAFAGLLTLLQHVAERELSGTPVARADMQMLLQIDQPLGTLTYFFQDNGTPNLMPVDKQVAAIADVFTEPNSSQVLEVGVGDVLPVYAVATIGGRRWLVRGGVLSYYEFHQPMSDRLTDQAWHALARRPDLPGWTASYVAQ